MNDVIADGVDGGTGGVACRLSVRDKARRFDSIANRNSLSEWNLCNTGIHHRDPPIHITGRPEGEASSFKLTNKMIILPRVTVFYSHKYTFVLTHHLKSFLFTPAEN